MGVELRAALAFGSAALISLALAPVAIALARRVAFFDRPRGYRQHVRATPFLGGLAVLVGFAVAGVGLGGGSIGAKQVILACGLVMWLLGTLDDRIAVSPWVRLAFEAGVAGVVYESGHGWSTGLRPVADIGLTVVWVLGLINAFNLMDNMDGACSTVAAVAAFAIGVLALVRGQTALAALSFALAGACAGFLPWNLAGPAKIFLGDGGSMLIGFLIAALAMAVTRHSASGHAGLLVGAMLVGLPILDVALVSVSRTRRGVSLMTGGRDHLTHRLALALGTPRRVALALAAGELALGAIAICAYELGTSAVAVLAALAAGAGVATIGLLDTPRWRPAGIAYGPTRSVPPAAEYGPAPAGPAHAEHV